jgi:hypothetical protein
MTHVLLGERPLDLLHPYHATISVQPQVLVRYASPLLLHVFWAQGAVRACSCQVLNLHTRCRYQVDMLCACAPASVHSCTAMCGSIAACSGFTIIRRVIVWTLC